MKTITLKRIKIGINILQGEKKIGSFSELEIIALSYVESMS